MKHFTYMQASSAKEAANETSSGTSWLMAGGTDVLGTLKDEILPDYPEGIVSLKSIGDLSGIQEDAASITIGALAKLHDLSRNDMLATHCKALSQAAGRVASPTIRHMGTIGGNVCQMHRCWYFRCPNNRFNCLRKGGDYCPARIGDNRYHSIFGSQNGCYAASSHDTAPALVALDAAMVTTDRTIAAEDFFQANGIRSNVLRDGEVLQKIIVPKSEKSAFQKFALRKTIDFPIVNCAVAQQADGTIRIALGGVYPAPIRMSEAEAEVKNGITEHSAEAAAEAAISTATPLSKNAYKVDIAKALIKRTLLEAAE